MVGKGGNARRMSWVFYRGGSSILIESMDYIRIFRVLALIQLVGDLLTELIRKVDPLTGSRRTVFLRSVTLLWVNLPASNLLASNLLAGNLLLVMNMPLMIMLRAFGKLIVCH